MPAAANLSRHICAWLDSACANCKNKSLRMGSASAAASAAYSAAPFNSSRKLSRYRSMSEFMAISFSRRQLRRWLLSWAGPAHAFVLDQALAYVQESNRFILEG